MPAEANISRAQLDSLLVDLSLEDPASATPTPTSTVQRKRLTDFEKGKIALLYEQKCTIQQIANQMGRPKSTIQTFIERYAERGTHENQPIPGRPKKYLSLPQTYCLPELNKIPTYPN